MKGRGCSSHVDFDPYVDDFMNSSKLTWEKNKSRPMSS